MQPSMQPIQRDASLNYIPEVDGKGTEWCVSHGDTKFELCDSNELQIPLPQVTENEKKRIAFWSSTRSAAIFPATSSN